MVPYAWFRVSSDFADLPELMYYHVLAALHIRIIFLGIILPITRHRHLAVNIQISPTSVGANVCICFGFIGFSNRFRRSLQQRKYRDS